MSMTSRHLFVMDPPDAIRVDQDSTFALMCEVQNRGAEVWFALVSDLFAQNADACASATQVTVQATQGDHVTVLQQETRLLVDFDVVWMRKDPPFNMDYIFATYVLDLAAQKTLVVNHPEGLRRINEKTWIQHFPDFIPETLVTQSMDQLRDFTERLGTAVVKPLDGCGGEGVFVVRHDDPNIGVILETSTAHGTRMVMAQRFIPEVSAGDKRIILVDGVPVGAIMRVPTGTDHRGNIHVGARVEGTHLTARDQEICATIGPLLEQAGQVFVGIDVIGGYLTEVNVTSPTGIHEINAHHGVRVESMLVDAVEARLAKA